jgi:hypothetical protein
MGNKMSFLKSAWAFAQGLNTRLSTIWHSTLVTLGAWLPTRGEGLGVDAILKAIAEGDSKGYSRLWRGLRIARLRHALHLELVASWECHLESRIGSPDWPTTLNVKELAVVRGGDQYKRAKLNPAYADTLYPFRRHLSTKKERKLRNRLVDVLSHSQPEDFTLNRGRLYAFEADSKPDDPPLNRGDHFLAGLRDRALWRNRATHVSTVEEVIEANDLDQPPTLHGIELANDRHLRSYLAELPSRRPAVIRTRATQTKKWPGPNDGSVVVGEEYELIASGTNWWARRDTKRLVHANSFIVLEVLIRARAPTPPPKEPTPRFDGDGGDDSDGGGDHPPQGKATRVETPAPEGDKAERSSSSSESDGSEAAETAPEPPVEDDGGLNTPEALTGLLASNPFVALSDPKPTPPPPTTQQGPPKTGEPSKVNVGGDKLQGEDAFYETTINHTRDYEVAQARVRMLTDRAALTADEKGELNHLKLLIEEWRNLVEWEKVKKTRERGLDTSKLAFGKLINPPKTRKAGTRIPFSVKEKVPIAYLVKGKLVPPPRDLARKARLAVQNGRATEEDAVIDWCARWAAYLSMVAKGSQVEIVIGEDGKIDMRATEKIVEALAMAREEMDWADDVPLDITQPSHLAVTVDAAISTEKDHSIASALAIETAWERKLSRNTYFLSTYGLTTDPHICFEAFLGTKMVDEHEANILRAVLRAKEGWFDTPTEAEAPVWTDVGSFRTGSILRFKDWSLVLWIFWVIKCDLILRHKGGVVFRKTSPMRFKEGFLPASYGGLMIFVGWADLRTGLVHQARSTKDQDGRVLNPPMPLQGVPREGGGFVPLEEVVKYFFPIVAPSRTLKQHGG